MKDLCQVMVRKHPTRAILPSMKEWELFIRWPGYIFFIETVERTIIIPVIVTYERVGSVRIKISYNHLSFILNSRYKHGSDN